MTDAQRDAIADAMKSYSGITIDVFCQEATEDSAAYAEKLADALRTAGIKVVGPRYGTMVFTGPIPPGTSLMIGEDRFAAADALGRAMKSVNLITSPLPASKNEARRDAFDITIAPNR
jgi:hypothetical protein